MSAERQWSDLPPELLAVVSDCLHDVADFIRFHAVCTPWRDSLPTTTTSELRRTCFPWLIDAPSGNRTSVIRLRCVFSRRGYYTAGRLSTLSWVAGGDGAAPHADEGNNTLVHPLTGDTTAVPPFPRGTRLGNSPGVVYADGTLFLYDLSRTYEEDVPTSFWAAVLRPGDTEWTVVESGFKEEVQFNSKHCFATYRVDDGKILVCLAVDRDRGHDVWHLLAPSPGGIQDVVVENDDDMCSRMKTSPDKLVNPEWHLESSHVLESHGELLRVSVLIRWQEYPSFARDGKCREEGSLVVSVHALDGGRTTHLPYTIGSDGQA